jgi:hypothetical protein
MSLHAVDLLDRALLAGRAAIYLLGWKVCFRMEAKCGVWVARVEFQSDDLGGESRCHILA